MKKNSKAKSDLKTAEAADSIKPIGNENRKRKASIPASIIVPSKVVKTIAKLPIKNDCGSSHLTPPTYLTQHQLDEILSNFREEIQKSMVTKEELESSLKEKETAVNSRLKVQVPLLVDVCVKSFRDDDTKVKNALTSLVRNSNKTVLYSKRHFTECVVEVTNEIGNLLVDRFPRLHHLRYRST